MIRPLLVAAAIVMLAASPAAAKKNGHGKGKGHGGNEHGGGSSVVDVDVNVVVFSPQQRVVFREYRDHHYGKSCPPGLAKKHNGCMPPGLAKKRYQVGQPLEHAILLAPVPPELQIRIGVPPVGYVYGMIDGDLVKLAAGSLMVVDAIQGLSD